MAVKIVATQTCDVCGVKIGDVAAASASAVPRRGIRVSTVNVSAEGETATDHDLYSFDEICEKCLDSVNHCFARLIKKNKTLAAKPPKVKKVRVAKVVSAPAVSVEGEVKKKRGRPRKNPDAAVTSSAISDAAPGSEESDDTGSSAATSPRNGAAESAHPF